MTRDDLTILLAKVPGDAEIQFEVYDSEVEGACFLTVYNVEFFRKDEEGFDVMCPPRRAETVVLF